GTMLAILSMGQTIHYAGHVSHIPVFALALVFPLLARFLPARVMLYGVILLWLGLVRAPLLDNILPVRLMLFVFLDAGVLLAVVVDAILRAPASRARLMAGLGVVVALALLIPTWPYPAATPPLP